MAKTKKKTSQLLALFMAAILVFSNFGSVAVAATTAEKGTDCNIANYTATSELKESDKSDSTQANTQTSTDTESATYSTSLLQSAKWTNKSDGEAKLNIHYTADLDTDTTATRSLYIFTTCNKHGFTERIAIENIIELLKYNDYVDVIMIGATNYKQGGENSDEATEVGAVLMFTLKADDFVGIEDGTGYLDVDDDNVTSYTGDSNTTTKASIIKAILETYTNAALISNNVKVHVLGCANDDNCSCSDTNYYTACTLGDACTVDAHDDTHYYDGASSSYGPYIEVLFDSVSEDKYSTESGYKFGDYEKYFQSAAALGLTFQPASHAGGLFSLYYIAKYIDIIETNYGSGSFSSIVENILNSFDAFTVANKNLSVQTSYTTYILYNYVYKYIGLDLTAANMDLSDMKSKCLEALSVIHEYNAANRYISLVPYSEDDATGDSLGFAEKDTKYTNSSTTEDDLNTAINTIFYCLALICPTDDILDEAASLEMIKEWIEKYAEEKDVYDELLNHNDNIHTYTYNLKNLGVLGEVSSIENSVTITTTIDSEFEVIKADDSTYDITVTNSGATNSSFDYEVVDVDTDTNTVTIKFTNLSADTYDAGGSILTTDDWIIDISIPVKLKNNTEFRTDDYDFKDTNGSGDTITTATATRTVTRTNNMVQTYTEKVTVDSPQLYKAPPALSIVKTSDVASAKVGDTVSYILTVSQTEADATATGVVVTDPIPEGLTYVNGTVKVTKDSADITNDVAVSYNEESGVLKLEGLGDLSTETITITYDVTVESGYEGKTLTNTATAEADNADKVGIEHDLTIQEATDDTEEEETGSDNTDPDGSITGSDGDGSDSGNTGSDGDGSDNTDTGSDDGTGDDATDPESGNTGTTGSGSSGNTSTTTDNENTTGATDGDAATDSSDESSDEGSADNGDDATTDETDDDATTSDTLPQTGDSASTLLSLIAALALGAFATAAASALALRRRRIKE